MRETKIGLLGIVSACLAMICACVLMYITDQEQKIDLACAAIETHDQNSSIIYIDEVNNINGVGERGETMLMVACESGNGAMIEYLLNAGADPNKSLVGKLTPLELYCNTGYEAGAQVLVNILESGTRQSQFTEKPAIFFLAEQLYWMTDEQKQIAEESIIEMLRHGAPFGYGQMTLLHPVAKADMASLFDTLIHTTEGLALINMEDENGNTPWEIAVKHGSISVQKTIRGLEEDYMEEHGTQSDNELLWPINPDEQVTSNTEIVFDEFGNPIVTQDGLDETESDWTAQSDGANIEPETETEPFNIDAYINDYLMPSETE